MNISATGVSCGVKQLYWLEDPYQPKEKVRRVRDYLVRQGYNGLEFGHMTFVFSDRKDRGYGVILAQYIRKYKLGKIVCTGDIQNINNGHTIRTWLWVVNLKACNNILRKRKVKNV